LTVPSVPYSLIPCFPSDSRNLSIRETFTSSQLAFATLDLHLPVWSRDYIPCDSNASEVSCSQVFHAWKVLNGLAASQTASFSSVNHFLMKHLYDGVGNQLSTDTTTFVIALMDNRSYSIQAFYPNAGKRRFGQVFEFHPAVTVLQVSNTNEVDNDWVTTSLAAYHLYMFSDWFRDRYADIFRGYKSLVVDLLLYGTVLSTNPDMVMFCYSHFGRHMVYFVCNYLMRIPERALQEAKAAIDPVPQEVSTFGVHLRFHQAKRCFAYSAKRTMNIVFPCA
jgi:hypothetical protein